MRCLNLSSTGTAGDAVTVFGLRPSAALPFALQQQYNFTGVGLFSTTDNWIKTTAYVLHSNVLGGVSGYYLLTSTGAVYAYDGSGSYASTIADSFNLVAQLSPSVFTTPTLLTQATAVTLPGDVVTVNNVPTHRRR